MPIDPISFFFCFLFTQALHLGTGIANSGLRWPAHTHTQKNTIIFCLTVGYYQDGTPIHSGQKNGAKIVFNLFFPSPILHINR